MNDKSSFFAVEYNKNKYNFDIKHYVLPKLQDLKIRKTDDDSVESVVIEEEKEILNVYLNKLCAFSIVQDDEVPKLCTYLFMDKDELTEYLHLEDFKQIKTIIQNKIEKDDFPAGIPRIILIDLIYSVTKFCIKSKFNLEQSGSIIGMFYSTHRYFTATVNKTPNEVHEFFTKCMLIHSIDFPPNSTKIFELEESKKIMLYFCSFYLRFLPLIRLVCLPNYAFSLDYTLEPEPAKSKGKNKKDKKDKKKGKKKK